MDLKVFDWNGHTHALTLDLAHDSPISALYTQVAMNLSAALGEPLQSHELRIFLAGRPLEEQDSPLHDFPFREHGIVTAVLRRKRKPRSLPTREEEQVDLALIERATAHLDSSPPPSLPPPITSHLLGHLRDVAGILARVGRLLQGEKGQSPAEEGNQDPPAQGPSQEEILAVDEDSLRELVSMGFSEEVSKKSLLLNHMSPILAIQWIITHQEDVDIGKPLTEEELELIKKRKRGKSPVSQQLVQSLQDMGFNKHDAVVALRASKNNLQAACDWLVEERSARNIVIEDEDEDEVCLDQNSPIVQSILSKYRIQSSLFSPRIVQALTSIQAEPSTFTNYLQDPEVGPFLINVTHAVRSEVR